MRSMKMDRWPALLTGSIVQDPAAQARWIDPVERLRQYKMTLEWMGRANTGVDRVVFCENSRASLAPLEYLEEFYRKRNREIEIYKVPMPEGASFPGKGWGEGLMIRWALQNVVSLGQSQWFMKITGRYQIRNLRRIMTAIETGLKTNPRPRFVCQASLEKDPPVVYTHCFWSEREFFIEHLLDVYEDVDDQRRNYLEHAMARRLLSLRDHSEIGVLRTPLIINGRWGSNGKAIMGIRERLTESFRQTFLGARPLEHFADPLHLGRGRPE